MNKLLDLLGYKLLPETGAGAYANMMVNFDTELKREEIKGFIIIAIAVVSISSFAVGLYAVCQAAMF